MPRNPGVQIPHHANGYSASRFTSTVHTLTIEKAINVIKEENEIIHSRMECKQSRWIHHRVGSCIVTYTHKQTNTLIRWNPIHENQIIQNAPPSDARES